MILICISLMSSGVEKIPVPFHVPVLHLRVFFEKIFTSSAYFLILWFLLLSYIYIYYIFGILTPSHIGFLKIFTHSVGEWVKGCLSILSVISFCCAEAF